MVTREDSTCVCFVKDPRMVPTLSPGDYAKPGIQGGSMSHWGIHGMGLPWGDE